MMQYGLEHAAALNPENLVQELISLAAESEKWNLVKTKDGVRMSRRLSESSHFQYIRGDTTVKASADEIFQAFCQPYEQLLPVFDAMAEKGQVIEGLSRTATSLEQICHVMYKFPFPFSKRDFVYYTKVTILPDGTAVYLGRSVDHPSTPPTSSVVRGLVLTSGVVAIPNASDPSLTNVSYIVQVDPKGMLTPAIVNWIAIEQAYNVGRLRNFIEAKN